MSSLKRLILHKENAAKHRYSEEKFQLRSQVHKNLTFSFSPNDLLELQFQHLTLSPFLLLKKIHSS